MASAALEIPPALSSRGKTESTPRNVKNRILDVAPSAAPPVYPKPMLLTFLCAVPYGNVFWVSTPALIDFTILSV
jgi:hypothetical protein